MVKEVQFKSMDGSIETPMLHVKKLTVKPETDSSSETTFSGTLSSTTLKGFSIEIEKLGVIKKEHYINLQKLLDLALTEGIQITTKETISFEGETFDEIWHYPRAKGSMEKTTNPGNEHTNEKYSFTASERQNGTV